MRLGAAQLVANKSELLECALVPGYRLVIAVVRCS
jgi:hypothetical protein